VSYIHTGIPVSCSASAVLHNKNKADQVENSHSRETCNLSLAGNARSHTDHRCHIAQMWARLAGRGLLASEHLGVDLYDGRNVLGYTDRADALRKAFEALDGRHVGRLDASDLRALATLDSPSANKAEVSACSQLLNLLFRLLSEMDCSRR
jgi:hypothetical protein